ncbi:MAG: helix-turn-helix domain-containing protein [Thermoleophilaceae bacterium]
MHPGAAPALLGVHGESVRDARVPLTDAYGAGALALEERMAIGAPRERTSLLLGWLAVRARTAPAPDPLIRATARALAVGPHRRIGALARELHVSERHLRHRVTAQVGYGPKRLGRVLRLRRAMAVANAGAGLAAASHVGGYADQAHFTSDCVALAGVPPGQLV